MIKERTAIVITDDGINHSLHYYIKESESDMEFECNMYNVGITLDSHSAEIENFSSVPAEAETLLNILYENYITPNYLFVVAEQFVTYQ